ncbi:ribosomal protein S18 acetylase RimI-like enzyme [Kribbella voronezhensis]|uniref:Ribosomal protein S18 acetylase RimI-like enzyme n=1 Tax=Kribbella voronezhensis TaxID=2512212 RepID=A0A4R7TE93_9ACTN|nr:GNAT family N-acetyltransferase [Kribbella voronezhensis]TDU89697.1 ribosomal protein S18 acetylase RimI-like enzyme [Kribbella voronezhensis]
MITYRPATPAEAPAVLSFWATAAEDADRPPDSPDAVLRLIARDPEALILAVDNNSADNGSGDLIVGSIIVGWDGWRCHLYRLAVAPTHRRRGIGRTLISLAEQRFTTYGGTRADAMVLDTNTTAHPTWQTAGYIPQPNWSRWVKPL